VADNSTASIGSQDFNSTTNALPYIVFNVSTNASDFEFDRWNWEEFYSLVDLYVANSTETNSTLDTSNLGPGITFDLLNYPELNLPYDDWESIA
jgi:hypothetical protein